MASRHRVSHIADLLIDWYRQGHRDLPWRRITDPYRIWISEIMLQQTRAQAVIPYYERFLARFPSVESLAAAPEQAVLAAWSGLGYYSRARLLRRAAQQIRAAGAFPGEFAAIRELPGVGDYTAAAIASIAFGLPHAVLDGNVLRVVARVEKDGSDIGSGQTRERFRSIAQEWLDLRAAEPPGIFNQALMELGATVCLVRKPLCLLCPLSQVCRAHATGTVEQLPVKLRRKEPVRLEGVLLIIRNRGKVLLRERSASERRMAGFWELPTPEQLPGAHILAAIGTVRHTITHHHYTFQVAKALAPRSRQPFRWFPPRELSEIPLSTTARKALRLAGVL